MKSSPLSQFDVVCLMPMWWGKEEVSITNLSLTVMFVVFFGILLFYGLYRNHMVPSVWQIMLESVFMYVYSFVYQQMGKEGLIYFPFVFSLFNFMLLLNLFSMLPYSFAATSHLIWTLYFSLSICLGIFFVGLFKHNMHFLKLFVPEVPLLLYPVMICIEMMSYMMSSFSLAMSLSANIISGHMLIHMLADSMGLLCNMKSLLLLMPFMLMLCIFMLELGVVCLQAYIFMTLICMYLNDALYMSAH